MDVKRLNHNGCSSQDPPSPAQSCHSDSDSNSALEKESFHPNLDQSAPPSPNPISPPRELTKGEQKVYSYQEEESCIDQEEQQTSKKTSPCSKHLKDYQPSKNTFRHHNSESDIGDKIELLCKAAESILENNSQPLEENSVSRKRSPSGLSLGETTEKVEGTRSPGLVQSVKDQTEVNISTKDSLLSPSESEKVTQTIVDAQKLLESLSHHLSETVEVPEVKMVQGNNGFVLGPVSPISVHNQSGARNVAQFTLPQQNGNFNLGSMVPHHVNTLMKCPSVVPKKENTHPYEICCENKSSDSNSNSNNSDDDEDIDIADEEEDWSFDEDEDITLGKQCPCVFKRSPSENGVKSPLQRQDSNQNSTCSSPALLTNPFYSPSHILQCPDCEQSFSCRVDLNRHRLKHITERSFKCSLCDKSFAFSFNLKSHERQHSGEKPYICNVCGLRFVHAFNFHEHRRVHNIRSHFVCSICLKWFGVESKYLLHIRKHSSVKPFKCNVCGKAFHRAAGLRAHELIHSEGKDLQQYACRFCERTFTNLSNKQMHERIHFGQKLFQCLKCSQTFTELTKLKEHRCLVPQQITCKVCKETFQSLQLLESHSRIHMPKIAKNMQALDSKFGIFKQRALVGTTRRRFSCKLCSQSFSTKRLLDDHGKIHQREKARFVCEVCSLGFTHASYLNLHLATHGDDSIAQRQRSNSTEKTVSTEPNVAGRCLSYESASPSSGRSRQSSGEHSTASISPTTLHSLPLISIKTEPQ